MGVHWVGEGYTAEALELMKAELARRNCSAPNQQELLETVTRESDEEARSLTGVRGLLALMVLVIAANSIIALARAGSFVFQGSPLRDLWFFIVLDACQGAFGIVVCALLVSRRPRAPRYAAMWFLLAMTTSIAVFMYSYLYAGQVAAYPLSILAAGALWLSYLSTSKRVKATYKPSDIMAEGD